MLKGSLFRVFGVFVGPCQGFDGMGCGVWRSFLGICPACTFMVRVARNDAPDT